mmetsp:Transcript_104610/g.326254  ORF Transcript_104610/g.326254 Transcript_104610/m.326254 type:complete len:154 (-) Transcript_104610:84-545(-)
MARRRSPCLLVSLVCAAALWISCSAPSFVPPSPPRTTRHDVPRSSVLSGRRPLHVARRSEKGSAGSVEESKEESELNVPLLVVGAFVAGLVYILNDNFFFSCLEGSVSNVSPCLQFSGGLFLVGAGVQLLVIYATVKEFVQAVTGGPAVPPVH